MLKKIKIDRPIIIALALILCVGLYIVLKPNPKIKLTANELVNLSDNIRKHYQNLPGYWGLNSEKAISLGIIPDAMTKEGKIINALGKEVLIGRGVNGETIMPGGRSFEIIYKNLSKKECVKLAEFEGHETYLLGLIDITVNDKVFSWGTEESLPISRKQARKYCLDNNAIIWKYE